MLARCSIADIFKCSEPAGPPLLFSGLSSGYRSRSPGFGSLCHNINWEVLDLERGPPSLVRIIEELLERKGSCSGLEKPRLTAVGIRCADNATPRAHRSWHQLRRPSIGIILLRTKGHGVCFLFDIPAIHRYSNNSGLKSRPRIEMTSWMLPTPNTQIPCGG
jgi:hypothetical protein